MRLAVRRRAELTRPGMLVLAASLAAFLFSGVLFLVIIGSPSTAPSATAAPDAIARPVSAAATPAAMPSPPLWGGPSASKEGETWTHRNLFDYLTSRGTVWYFHETHRGGFYGPAVFCVHNPTADDREFLQNVERDLRFDAAIKYTYVQKRASAGNARDDAALKPSAFSWGRFFFEGRPEDLQIIRAALGA